MTKTRIMIVEDEEISARDIQSKLLDLGYEVPGIAYSGLEAIELAKSLMPDLIFMDIVLNGKMDGIDAAVIITKTINIPIIFLTANNDDDTFNRAKLCEPYGYLSKPLNTRDLRATVELALFKHKTSMRLAEKQATYLHHDPLTGLARINLLEHFVIKSILVSRKTAKQFAILFLGIDNFKRINDTLGHTAGNELLKFVGERLNKAISPTDFAARLGGDIFALVLTDIPNSYAAATFAKKVQVNFIEFFKLNKKNYHITLSIGISVYPDNGEDAETLIKNADIAMHRAKSSGRNNYQFWTGEMTEQTQNRVDVETLLHTALDKEEFLLYYQPQVSLHTGKIIGAEALLRFKSGNENPRISNELISVAEETGLIVAIGEWALQTACAQSRAWENAGFILANISVNVSARQFFGDRLIKTVEAIIKEYNIRNLELEITESMLMHDVALATKQLKFLKNCGVQIALDDFGTGYSSLSYLRQFPFSKLKLDKSFVTSSVNNSSDAAMMNAIITLGHTLGLTVIAEGVETQEQLALLIKYGCDEIQGYYFSPPVSAAEMTELLKTNRSLV